MALEVLAEPVAEVVLAQKRFEVTHHDGRLLIDDRAVEAPGFVQVFKRLTDRVGAWRAVHFVRGRVVRQQDPRRRGLTWLQQLRVAIGTPTGREMLAVEMTGPVAEVPKAVGMAAAVTAVTSSIISASATPTIAFNAVNNANGRTSITGSVANGAAAGTVQLQFESGTAGQTSTVFTNSYLAARKL